MTARARLTLGGGAWTLVSGQAPPGPPGEFQEAPLTEELGTGGGSPSARSRARFTFPRRKVGNACARCGVPSLAVSVSAWRSWPPQLIPQVSLILSVCLPHGVCSGQGCPGPVSEDMLEGTWLPSSVSHPGLDMAPEPSGVIAHALILIPSFS